MSGDSVIHIAILTTNSFFAQSLKSMLNHVENFDIVAASRHIAEISCRVKPDIDVLLLDAGFGKSEYKIINETIRTVCPKVKIILISHYQDEVYLKTLLAPGIDHIIYANSKKEDYIASIRKAKTTHGSSSAKQE